MLNLTDEALYQLLSERVGRVHLRQRLGLEADYHAWVFGRGRKLFHPENWYTAPVIIRSALKLSLLYGRARRNALAIRLRHNEVRLDGLPAAFDGYKILHISDPHFDMNADFPEVLAERVCAIDYDICVFTGDYRYRTYGPVEPALEGFRQVRARLKDPVYGILGNHDSIRMVPAIEALGVRMLINESVTLTRAGAVVHLLGIDDAHYYRADNLDRAWRDLDHDQLSILLSHTPEFYRHAAHAGIALMLCGHTHGGQICLPSGIPIICDARCPRRLAAGPWQYHDLIGYTSVGAGSSIVDVRLNCQPEVTLHELRCL